MTALVGVLEASLVSDVLSIGLPLVYLLGILSALDAIMTARTPQGSVAWAIALVAFPPVALPFYWFLGRSRYTDYIEALQHFDRRIEASIQHARKGPLADFLSTTEDERGELRAFQKLATFPFTRSNHVSLLVDGEATFTSIFDAISRAESYVLVEYYLLRDDEVGRRLLAVLEERARAGVKVHMLLDSLGSSSLPRRYYRSMRSAGIQVTNFPGRYGRLHRFLRINFRNHRKIIVVDGRTAFIGGLNMGDEYLGRHPRLSPWRDTHLKMEGPSVQGVQLAWIRDWHFCTGDLPSLDWEPATGGSDQAALIHATGPDDRLERASLLYTHAIQSAEHRAWVATAYFVPDPAVYSALQVAALRGVDVRVLIPRQSDTWLFKFVPYAFLAEAQNVGVKFYFYEPGFMHQKVLLVDDDYAAVSTANLDNRSFRLNFEITAVIADRDFCDEVARMLEKDFEHSTPGTADELMDHGLAFRIAVRVTRLLAPIL